MSAAGYGVFYFSLGGKADHRPVGGKTAAVAAGDLQSLTVRIGKSALFSGFGINFQSLDHAGFKPAGNQKSSRCAQRSKFGIAQRGGGREEFQDAATLVQQQLVERFLRFKVGFQRKRAVFVGAGPQILVVAVQMESVDGTETLKERWRTENDRYTKIYNTNNLNPNNYNLVISSNNLTPSEIADKIYKEYKKFMQNA